MACTQDGTGSSAGSSDAVPLAKGLVFTTTSHAGLATTTGSVPVADTEAVYSIVGGDEERLLFRFTVSAPPDSAAGKMLDGVPSSIDRTVRREDLRSATRLTIFSSSTDPALLEDLQKANLSDPLEIAFCLASAVQHERDVAFWFPRAAANPEKTARFLIQFIQNSPLDHERPAYRAARLLELLPAQARNEALEAFQREVDPNDVAEKVREIVGAIRERRVVELVGRTEYLTGAPKA